MSKKDEIAELISRTALGDQKSFRLLYDRTGAKLLGVILRILKDRNESEAVLQEVYVKVWNKADQYSSGRAAGITWLAAIARNQAIDVIRSRKAPTLDIEEIYDLADNAPTPEENAVSGSQNRQVQNCLDELDERHAMMVRQTYLNGWSYDQAARHAKVPLNTAKTWIRRSLLALRDCLKR
ncbi:MAG TPA: sigma-70 family RNA polymerase sigma factor [Rhizobiales bacterium]|nr:sigma-70 family RNA polymerase sigma factor [Hyphomicrobiales bacterium]